MDMGVQFRYIHKQEEEEETNHRFLFACVQISLHWLPVARFASNLCNKNALLGSMFLHK